MRIACTRTHPVHVRQALQQLGRDEHLAAVQTCVRHATGHLPVRVVHVGQVQVAEAGAQGSADTCRQLIIKRGLRRALPPCRARAKSQLWDGPPGAKLHGIHVRVGRAIAGRSSLTSTSLGAVCEAVLAIGRESTHAHGADGCGPHTTTGALEPAAYGLVPTQLHGAPCRA
eukprot:351144-Chlamydomonas_euryale.AAC.5